MAWTKKRFSSVVIVLAVVVIAAVLGWRLYRPPALYCVTILPSLGGHLTQAYSLNDRGQVAGMAYIGSDPHLFLWDREHGIQDLGPVLGGSAMINNAGQISAAMNVEPNSYEGFLWEPGRGRTMLGTLGGKWSVVSGMNNRGQIIGLCHSAGPHSPAFIWEKATGMRRLSGPDSTSCIPVSINDTGRVLVYLIDRQPSPKRYFLIDPNGPVFLDTGGRNIQLLSINNRSCMAGIEEPGFPRAHLVLWDEHKTLRRLVPINTNWMTRLNDRNQIAYTNVRRNPLRALEDRYIRHRWPIDIEERVSYLWDPVRGRVPLNRYVHGVERFYVADLNNNGCIVGTAEMKDGSTRSVLLEPIPERWGK